MTYHWQHPEWPEFKYSLAEVEELLFDFAQKTGQVSGLLEGLPQEIQTEAIIEIMVSEAVKISEIEGEYLCRQNVMSSIKNNLGLVQKLEKVHDQRAEGVAGLMLDVRN